ncbi:uncharacterized protein K452DRAFT_103487 [Aplosporella prunicola CBS 121167]|uniref:Uncharacterized protein n=1 Tax=Aplosporella prunicola CBS 121167 TaxID=1176127 RepID=A0A6A6BRS9_9PEZI|nr:uncharacterized protein K452DRAFT_103487 [Aplosporella prunicola CBS 121167]KAF2145924.1 hypothetical protein K452DRAFT_103487 [Aplosporella prunicola CBS 121167]
MRERGERRRAHAHGERDRDGERNDTGERKISTLPLHIHTVSLYTTHSTHSIIYTPSSLIRPTDRPSVRSLVRPRSAQRVYRNRQQQPDNKQTETEPQSANKRKRKRKKRCAEMYRRAEKCNMRRNRDSKKKRRGKEIRRKER